MNCARLDLKERVSSRVCPIERHGRVPPRFCQRQLVDPTHNDNPRWSPVDYGRFHLKEEYEELQDDTILPEPTDNIYLSVQTLKFHGDNDESQRPRTSFKYKSRVKPHSHRMFVKEVVEEPDRNDEEDMESHISSSYFNDYFQYVLKAEQTKSLTKENKATQVETKINKHKVQKVENNISNENKKEKIIDESSRYDDDYEKCMEDVKISFQKFGKRKSLTISRVPSPQTVQVIRVDVVCNNYLSADTSLCNFDDDQSQMESETQNNSIISKFDVRNTQFANRYLLTKSVKTLEENISGGGAKVTLMCKTFRLANRMEKRHKETSQNLK